MEWWLWIAVGLALTVAELATPSGFFIIFFGLAALTVGILTGLDMAGGTSVQWLLFSVLSIAYVLVFRGRLQRKVAMPEARDVDSLIGVLAIVQERLLPGVVGKVEVRGWDVVHLMAQGRSEPHPYTAAARIVEGRLDYSLPSGPQPSLF